jgi:hypothetical protein
MKTAIFQGYSQSRLAFPELLIEIRCVTRVRSYFISLFVDIMDNWPKPLHSVF